MQRSIPEFNTIVFKAMKELLPGAHLTENDAETIAARILENYNIFPRIDDELAQPNEPRGPIAPEPRVLACIAPEKWMPKANLQKPVFPKSVEIDDVFKAPSWFVRFYDWLFGIKPIKTKIEWVKNPYIKLPIVAECRILHPDAKLPERKRDTDAAYDLYSIDDKIIRPHNSAHIRTGLALSLLPGHYYTIESRSGLALRNGLVAVRGILDATYCGEIIIIMVNNSDEEYNVHNGDRIAQMMVHQVNSVEMVVVDEFSAPYNQRGLNGFGSSGR